MSSILDGCGSLLKANTGSTIRSNDAYMLIYTRRVDNDLNVPKPKPVPPPLALSVIEELNNAHEARKAHHAQTYMSRLHPHIIRSLMKLDVIVYRIADLTDCFETARRNKLAIYSCWDAGDELVRRGPALEFLTSS
jgi:hypothetical protein